MTTFRSTATSTIAVAVALLAAWASPAAAAPGDLFATPLHDIQPGGSDSEPRYFTDLNGTAYFAARGEGGEELWRNTGALAGAVRVADIRPGGSGSGPQHLAAFGGHVYFSADDGAHGVELWRANAAGATLVEDINLDPALGNSSSFPDRFTPVGDALFFNARGQTGGDELYKLEDGDVTLVEDINQTSPTAASDPDNLIAFEGKLYFSATDGVAGRELWVSDGTQAGTHQVGADINPGGADGIPFNFGLTVLGEHLLFVGNNGTTGWELWKSDGETTPTMVENLNGTSGGFPQGPTVHDGFVYFSAEDTGVGRELHRSDGNSIDLVADISPTDSSYPASLTSYDGAVLFGAHRPGDGYELWRTEGTGATMIDLLPGPGSGSPGELTVAGEHLFLVAGRPAEGHELWISDGTQANTGPFEDINPGPLSSQSQGLTEVGQSVFLSAERDGLGLEPWRAGVEEAPPPEQGGGGSGDGTRPTDPRGSKPGAKCKKPKGKKAPGKKRKCKRKKRKR